MVRCRVTDVFDADFLYAPRAGGYLVRCLRVWAKQCEGVRTVWKKR